MGRGRIILVYPPFVDIDMDKVTYLNAPSFRVHIPEPGSCGNDDIGGIEDVTGNPSGDYIPKREDGAVAYYSLAAGCCKEGYPRAQISSTMHRRGFIRPFPPMRTGLAYASRCLGSRRGIYRVPA